MHPLCRLGFQVSQFLAHAAGKLRRSDINAHMKCTEEISRKPCLRQPLCLGKERDRNENAEHYKDQAFYKAEQSPGEPVQASQSDLLEKLRQQRSQNRR